MLITDILTENARMYETRTALIEREPAINKRREITWALFDKHANCISNFLIQKGIKKGDRIIQLMTNCLEWLPVYFGILRTGALAVPLNFRFSSEKIELCSMTSTPKLFIFGEEFIERLESIKKTLDQTVSAYLFTGPENIMPVWAIHYNEIFNHPDWNHPDVPITIEDDAALYFTSGTTGMPKAVLLTHKNLSFACEVENRHHKQTHDDNFLCIPPLYHTGAKMHWFGNFLVGAKSVLLKGVKPEWILEAVSEEKITIVWLLVPWAHDIIIAIENKDVDLARYNLSTWRLMHIGAQPVPPSLIKKWKKLFPDHDYDTNYGLTESTGPGCIHLGMENIHKVGAIGKPGFGWEYDIVDGEMKHLPPGESGELVVKGDGVMKAYFKNPEATRETLVNGWLKTGDIARCDESGFVWLVDRKKDIIITGGENIYPVEIENFFMTHDKIQDVAVIGYPDERLGEIVIAIILVKKGQSITEEEVRAFSQHLPRYKRPRKIIFGDVPRNPTGKIEKPRLRRKYIHLPDDLRKTL
ncbi:MAG: acyl--CoA ligase [Proteobacteria bacterium]|nr:acyl--CoA ligase [Pseudomonadota bacterium]